MYCQGQRLFFFVLEVRTQVLCRIYGCLTLQQNDSHVLIQAPGIHKHSPNRAVMYSFGHLRSLIEQGFPAFLKKNFLFLRSCDSIVKKYWALKRYSNVFLPVLESRWQVKTGTKKWHEFPLGAFSVNSWIRKRKTVVYTVIKQSGEDVFTKMGGTAI